MSIRRKLAIIFSIIVSSILILNNVLFYYNTRDMLIQNQKKQMRNTAREISIAIQQSQVGARDMEDLMGVQLRTAALVAQRALDPDIRQVTNAQLVMLAKEIGVSDITLFAKQGDDIVGLKSSDPKEVNVSTKSWGFWNTAMNQLFDQKEVTIKEGQKLAHYWSGKIDVATTDPSKVNKWGYYYDGTTNYIIDPYIRDDHFVQYENLTGPETIIQKSLQSSGFIEITGFNPKAFGKDPIISKKSGVDLVSLGNRPISFGSYTYKDSKDVASVQQVSQTGRGVSYEVQVGDKDLLKAFMPVTNTSTPYVIGFVADYQVIYDVLKRQLLRNVVISLLVLLVVFVVSALIAGLVVKPLQTILKSVNEMAAGNLGLRVEVNRNDELGRLADCVNSMSEHLQVYTEELKSLIEQNPAAIFSFDLHGKCLSANPAAEKMLGYSWQELRDKTVISMMVEAEIEKSMPYFTGMKGSWENFIVSFLHKDGHTIELGMKNVPIVVNEQIVGVYCIARDITESKKTEAILRKSDKLAVVGRLAAGVAHEIRNPLTAIKGFVQFIKSSENPKPEYFDIMLSELDRIEFIVNEFLVLAKPQAMNYQLKDLNVLLQNIIALIDTQAIMNNVQILMMISSEKELPLIECEENQLKQVFINILKNALEAMPDGGNVYVSVKRTADDKVHVQFVDEGCGIPPERVAKLGEPFYTTKEKGTGLGLMVSYKIINEHQGQINVTSELNIGTTVDVVLPIRLEKKQQAPFR
ncbi:MAG: ATP-binding protein, partial [Tumebacillaceae bacterium]